MPKISVIIPVYNVEKILVRCLESVRLQTFQDFEVLVLNDGSTDASGDIAKKYCSKNKNFFYLEHENMGQGLTRNRGIELSQSDYLFFLDSDDYLEFNGLEILYNAINNCDSNIVVGRKKVVHDDESLDFIAYNFNQSETIDLNEMNIKTFSKDYYFSHKYAFEPWDKLYEANFIRDNKIQFGDNNKVFSEDNYFQLQIILNKPQITFVNEVVINYYQREGSTTNSYTLNMVDKQIELVNDIFGVNSERKDDFFDYILVPLIFETIVMEGLNLKGLSNSKEKLIESMQKLRQYELYEESLQIMVEKKIYKVYPKKSKQAFVRFISSLELRHLYAVSNNVISKVYLRNG